MIFAYATDERSLRIFDSEAHAIAYCEGPDVELGVWKFFGPLGESLVAEFTEPVRHGALTVSQGRYRLCPGDGESLVDLLPRIEYVEGGPGLSSVADVAHALNRSYGDPAGRGIE